ncbi:MBL fold metallo-hydrolase [Mycobacterium sp. 236(2023)]|uniref:MBL fold metallo-hydrolase n=1 Tax=Mycobacterium sp. 236(2023) TaxID=3038163 RepID=UPI00241587D5|nr:MBL fold metallo-hydrolase [Mycobacterium sp. 236(2023)]MDG4667072.1 MBL fold metallo-hydrolase [Mycobacterium sp. 236(2023)]
MRGGCGCGDGHDLSAISRRAALTGSVILGAGLLGAATGTSSAQPTQTPPEALPDTALITLGVQAGPPPVPHRVGISSALKIGSDVYVIDCGLGSLNAFANAGLRFGDVKKMFITHLHADHIVDYYSFFLSGGASMRPGATAVEVFGPGPAGGLPPSEVGNPNPAVVDPGNPAPGLAATTDALIQAFAYTSNIFIRDNGTNNVEDLIRVNEIAVPPGSDFRNRSPKMEPFHVVSDDNVDVAAILVPHYDVYPSFAFRFDLKKSGVSVTFSGDTVKSDNIVTLARGTDVLVHEAMFSLDTAFYGNRFPPNYLPNSHTSAVQVGEVAAAVAPGHLIVSHYDPPDLPDSQWFEAIGKNFTGRTTIARDGQVFPL